MISSQAFVSTNADGDHQLKRMKTVDDRKFAEDFFFQSHPFSDLILLVQDRELYVDKSVLAAASKVFQSYLEVENIDSIEILDVTPNEMIELLRFLYPQFQCTINNQNVTVLLVLAHRFQLKFISSACRTFILFYLSKLKSINVFNGELIEQEDGTRISISSMLEILYIWLGEFSFSEDMLASDAIQKKLAQCQSSIIALSNGFDDLEEKLKWKIFQGRAKYLEQQLSHH